MLIRLVVRAPFLVIGATVMALLLDWKLACIFFVAAPLMALVLYLVMSRSIPFYRIIQKKLDRISLITRENLSGVRVIRAFSRQEKEKERFAQASEDQMSTSIAVGRISALLNPLTSAIINLAIAAVIWFGGFRVDAGGMTQGEVIAFVNYLNQILLAMIVVANLVVIFTKAAASATRVDEVLELHPSIVNRVSRPAQEVEGSPEIAFDAVSFAYPGRGRLFAQRHLLHRCARPDAGHHRRHRLRQIDAGQPYSPLLRGQPGQLKGGRRGRARLPDGAAARQGGDCAAEGGALFRHAAPEHAMAQAGRHR